MYLGGVIQTEFHSCFIQNRVIEVDAVTGFNTHVILTLVLLI